MQQISYEQLDHIAPEHIFVDLDGTLIEQELMYTTAWQVLRKYPHTVLRLLAGKLYFKLRLAEYVQHWTFNQQLLKILTNRRVTVITGSCEELARRITSSLPFVENVIGSKPGLDCLGLTKLKIIKTFDYEPFYIGNSKQDIPILQQISGCLISPKLRLARQLPSTCYWIKS